MFERFTEPARQVVVMAQAQARELGHSYIGTEHLLLGLLGVTDGAAARALRSLGLSLEQARASVVELVGQGAAEISGGQIPFTPRAKKVLEVALREALALGHKYIGTEHILLGLVREPQGPAIEILGVAGVTPEQIRSEVLRSLPAGEPLPQGRPVTAGAAALAAAPSFSVRPDRELRRLLMAAGGRALADEREEFGLRDLLAVVQAEQTGFASRSEDVVPGSETL